MHFSIKMMNLRIPFLLNIHIFGEPISIWYVRTKLIYEIHCKVLKFLYQVKDICYIWEVDITNITFVSQLTKSEGLEKISLLLVIDLLHVQDLWNAFETVESFKKNMEAETKTIVNFGIIGMKYDLFEVIIFYAGF
jgi:hypothetical protein